MRTIKDNNFDSLLLEPFQLGDQKVSFRAYAGGGRAGYVFRVRIGEKLYALKMFKFDHPGLNVSRYKGTLRRAFCDPFYIECRANGSLIQQGLNGKITPFCYGWLEVPTSAEIQVAKRWNIQPFLWDRPPSASDQKVHAILFEWIDGKTLLQLPTNSNVANEARIKLKALHEAQIAHGDLAASNILVQGNESDQRVYIIDLSASLSLPHIRFTAQELTRIQNEELKTLETGFALLSRVPINEGLCVTDLSALDGLSLEQIITDSKDIQRLWSPPRPTCWQGQP